MYGELIGYGLLVLLVFYPCAYAVIRVSGQCSNNENGDLEL